MVMPDFVRSPFGRAGGGVSPSGPEKTLLSGESWLRPKPCEEPCAKCGSTDAHRKLVKKDAEFSYYKNQTPTPKLYLKIKAPGSIGEIYSDVWLATRDYIDHTCNCCGYQWHGKTLA